MLQRCSSQLDSNHAASAALQLDSNHAVSAALQLDSHHSSCAALQVVLKPAELTPMTALALAELATRAGVPDGVLNVVLGDAPAIGSALLASETVRKIGFTGSTAVGKSIMAQVGWFQVAFKLSCSADALCVSPLA